MGIDRIKVYVNAIVNGLAEGKDDRVGASDPENTLFINYPGSLQMIYHLIYAIWYFLVALPRAFLFAHYFF